ncbi:MAG: glycosyltransferase family 1 protein [Clostridia bacterium]|nr:glycosyltransferase family 1 protein [Clostridia bacterium]
MNSGGAETFLMKLYRTLDRTKYQMDFCVNLREENFYEKEISNLGGKIYCIPPKSAGVKEWKEKLTDIIKTNRYDYVLRITSNAAGFMDLMVAKKAGAKITSARSSNSSDGTGIKAKLIHRLSRVLYGKYVDVKFAPSDLAAEYTFGKNSLEKGRATILHNAVDLDTYKFYPQEREALRKEFGLEGKLVVGHIGRFMTQKNHKFLLEVFSEIKKMHSDAVLLLVGGNGNLEGEIKQRVVDMKLQDDVVFAGVRSDVPQLLSVMDVFVMPSFYEGMPNTVIEAQSTGLSCVIADTITKQANITGLVEYLSLDESAEYWAQKSLEAAKKERKETKQDFINAKYDIESVTKEFVRLVFGEEN